MRWRRRNDFKGDREVDRSPVNHGTDLILLRFHSTGQAILNGPQMNPDGMANLLMTSWTHPHRPIGDLSKETSSLCMHPVFLKGLSLRDGVHICRQWIFPLLQERTARLLFCGIEWQTYIANDWSGTLVTALSDSICTPHSLQKYRRAHGAWPRNDKPDDHQEVDSFDPF